MVRERLTFDIDGDARGFSQAMGQAARASRDLTRILDRLSREGDDTERQLDDVGDSMVDMGGDAKRAAQSTGTLTTSVTKLALQFNVIDRAIDAATRAIAGMVRGVIEANRQGIALNLGFQTMAVRLEGVIGSAKGAQDALDAFRRIAGSTAFSVTDVSEAGTTLAAFMGGEFTKNVEGTTKAVADLAAFMGLNATEAASAMGRAFAGGAGAADILRERGVLNLIKSFQGIEDLTKLTLPEFREALLDTMVNTAGPIAGATDRMSATTVGAISNMGDAWENFTARMTEEAMPEITEFARAVTDVFTKAAEDVTGEKGLGNAIASITDLIRANKDDIVTALTAITKAVGLLAQAAAPLASLFAAISRFSPAGIAIKGLPGNELAGMLDERFGFRDRPLPPPGLLTKGAAAGVGAGGAGVRGGVTNVMPFQELSPVPGTTPAEARLIRLAGLRQQARNTAAAIAARSARVASGGDFPVSTRARALRFESDLLPTPGTPRHVRRAAARARSTALGVQMTRGLGQDALGAGSMAERDATREGLAAFNEFVRALDAADFKAVAGNVSEMGGGLSSLHGQLTGVTEATEDAASAQRRYMDAIDTTARNLSAALGPEAGRAAFSSLEAVRIFDRARPQRQRGRERRLGRPRTLAARSVGVRVSSSPQAGALRGLRPRGLRLVVRRARLSVQSSRRVRNCSTYSNAGARPPGKCRRPLKGRSGRSGSAYPHSSPRGLTTQPSRRPSSRWSRR